MGEIFRESDMKTSRFETAMWAAKLLFLSAGIISIFMFFKVAIIPYIFHLVFSVFSSVPGVWISLRSWLSPPYIYIVLNFIIITIAASSTFQRQERHLSDDHENRRKGTVIVTIKRKTSKTEKKKGNVDSNKEKAQTEDFQLVTAAIGGRERENEGNPSQETSFKDSSMEEDSGETPEKTEELASLEETWRLITEGPGKEQKPQLKKGETVVDTSSQMAAVVETGTDDGDREDDPATWAKRELRKSDTFNDRVSLRRKKSMSQDELNRRSVAFIRKFKNDIRLQRLESDQRSMEMVHNHQGF